MKRPTIVHFTDAAAVGGAERMLLTAMGNVDSVRWRQVLLHHANAAGEEVATAAREMGVETRAVPAGSGWRGAVGVPEIIAALGAEHCAVFHAHLPWTLRCTRGIAAARLARVKAVVATQQLYELPRTRSRRLRQSFASRLVDRYVAVSEAMADELRSVVAYPERVTVINNAIHPERFHGVGRELREEFVNGAERPIALTLARLDFQKGLETLIEAAATLPDVLFLIAGDGPERARLEAVARDRGVADRVRFLGRRSDVPKLLSACDVFVLPSLFEGLPVSVLEAMAASRPVVATSIPGTAEAVVDGETGWLVPPRDPAALAAAVARVVADPAMGRRMGEAGLLRVRARYSAAELGRRLDALYGELLHRAPEPSAEAMVAAGSGKSRDYP